MQDTCVGYGMRHINWIRIVLDGTTARAEAHGIGHRLPRTMAMSLAAAASLAADGVPVLVTRVTARPAATAR